MNTIISRTLLATSIVLAAPFAANAAPVVALATSVPIVVSDVNVQPTGSEDQGPGFVSLAFKNTSSVAANEVTFELDANGRYNRQIDDVGTFAPGVVIKHAYFDFSGASDQQIKVIKAQFTDGTSWTNADAAAPRSRRQAT